MAGYQLGGSLNIGCGYGMGVAQFIAFGHIDVENEICTILELYRGNYPSYSFFWDKFLWFEMGIRRLTIFDVTTLYF